MDALKKHYPEYLEDEGIKWDFTKFLIDHEGNVVKRYEPITSPSAMLAAMVKVPYTELPALLAIAWLAVFYACVGRMFHFVQLHKSTWGQEVAVLVEITQNCIAENARIAQDQGEY